MVQSVRLLQEACWLTAIVAVPLAVDPWHSDLGAFGTNPFIALRGAILVACGVALLLLSIAREAEGQQEPLRAFLARPLVGAALLLLAIQAISTAASMYPWVSLWGSSYRGRGLVTFAACTMIFLAIARYADREQRERVVIAVLLTAVSVSLWALYASVWIDGRTSGTLGNALFLAAYLLVPIFIAATYLDKRVGIMWPVYLVLLAAFFVSTSRVASLGMILGFGYLLWQGTRKRVAFLGIAVGVLVIVARMGPGFTDNGVVRAQIWEASGVTMLDSPLSRQLIGYGPDTFGMQAGIAGALGQEHVVESAHNIFLHAFVTTGAAGLLACLWLWGVAGWSAFHSAAAWTFPVIAASFVEGLSGIIYAPVLLMFWITLGCIESEVPARCEST